MNARTIIIHGEADKRIPLEASLRLGYLLKPTDELIVLKKQGHNGFEYNKEYALHLIRILE